MTASMRGHNRANRLVGHRRPSHGARRACLLATVGVLLASPATAQTVNDPGLQVEVVATGLSQPTTMAFIGDDDILVLQKANGQVRRIIGGVRFWTSASIRSTSGGCSGSLSTRISP